MRNKAFRIKVFPFYKNVSRTSAVSSTNFGSILIFASCVVGTRNILRMWVSFFHNEREGSYSPVKTLFIGSIVYSSSTVVLKLCDNIAFACSWRRDIDSLDAICHGCSRSSFGNMRLESTRLFHCLLSCFLQHKLARPAGCSMLSDIILLLAGSYHAT